MRRAGRFAAYVLDLGLYGHPERRGDCAVDEVKFWEADDSGRLKNLARCPVYPLRKLDDLVAAAEMAEMDETVVEKVILPEDEDDPQPDPIQALLPS